MKALIVDDDRVLADVVAYTFKREGFEVLLAYDGKTALQRIQEISPDLILLDVNMPGMDGFQVCQKIREDSLTPIILLTVRGEEDDIVQGLGLGADDYVVKPFSPRQLVARAEAVLRRAGQEASAGKIEVGPLLHCRANRWVEVQNGTRIQLTALENRMLECLLINSGQVVTKEILIDHIWGPLGGDDDMLRQVVHRLRSKIEMDTGNPQLLKTVPGLGYGFIP